MTPAPLAPLDGALVGGGAALRRALYEGAVVRVAPLAATLAYAERARALVEHEVGAPLEDAQARWSAVELFAGVTRARRALLADEAWASDAAAMLEALGLEPARLLVDAPRLRCVPSDGHRIAAAAPAYYAHRDTWYGNPRAQLNAWLALHDVEEARTFALYLAAHARAVENDSERFDLDDWERRVGFQNPAPGVDAVYPRAFAPETWGPALRFAARRGEVLLFAAAALHATCAHGAGRARFSVDFRVVDLAEHAAGLGAPDPDNRSRGSTLPSYRAVCAPRDP